MNILILISIALLLLSLSFARGYWYAPTNLMLAVWIVCLIGYNFFDKGLHPICPSTIWAISLWLIGFCLAAWTIQSLYIKPLFLHVPSNTIARDIFYYFTIATIPVMIIWVIWVAKNAGTNIFSALRDANISEQNGIRTAAFFVIFWLVSYVLELQVVSRHNIMRVIILFIANLFYAFASMGKMNFMILFLATAIILYERKLVQIKHLAFALIILLASFVAIQTIRGSYTNPQHFTALYLTSSIANLDQNVSPCSATLPAENSCRLFYAIRSTIDGGKTPVVDPILSFKWVEVGKLQYYSNTYTALYPFYKDFGLPGIAICAIMLGAFFGYLFKTAKDGSHFALALYAILSGGIVMQTIGDTFFTTLSQNIQYTLVTLIPYIISKHNWFTIKATNNG